MVVQDKVQGRIGQIKIDLSIKEYVINKGWVNGKRKICKLKYPVLSKIMFVLEKTGARVLRTSVKGKYIVIDYVA